MRSALTIALVRLFVADLGRDVDRMTKALEANDLKKLAFLARRSGS